MKLLIDSSAFAKRYVLEEGSQQVDTILQGASELALCTILIPELISALNRRLWENAITPNEYLTLKRRLMKDIRDTVILQLTPRVITHSVSLLENQVLRAMDALYLACAIEWKADLFVTADKRQWTAAQQSGVRSEYIGNHLDKLAK